MLHHITKRQKIIVMFAVMSGLFLAALDQSIVSTALPTIVSEFNGLNELSWVITSYLLLSTITVPIAGKLSDIFGRRKVLLTGIMIFVTASMLTGAAWNMWSLIAFRAIQGLGGGIIMSSAFSVIGDLFVPAERPKWQGVFGAVFGLSSVAGPLLGGFFTDNISWRWCFYINVPIGIIAFILIARYLPTIVEKTIRPSIDYVGAVLLSVGLTALLLGFTSAENAYPWGSWQVIGMISFAITVLAVFLRYESKHANAILPMIIFKNDIFRVSAVMLFLVGVAMFGAIIYLPLFAQTVLNASATNSGVILLPMVLAMTVTAAISGQIMSRIGKYKKIAIAGTYITTGSLFWLSTLSASSSHTDLVLRMIPLGIGLGIMMPLFNLVVQNAFPQKLLGVASSSTQLFRGIGSTVGVALMGTLLAHTLNMKVADLQSSVYVKHLHSQGQTLDANSLQRAISSDGQKNMQQTISKMPKSEQQDISATYDEFIVDGQDALASSITRVFLAGAIVLITACIAVLYLREIPLRKTMDHSDVPV